ncbi:MAG: hypothetical protein D6B28_02945 [Gammaproteobacteria bacterium]|nr:MAG: hypothetical protein D6B28_02945 [Gammaproteobacteria bacterium]
MFAEDIIGKTPKVQVAVRSKRRITQTTSGTDLDGLKRQKEYLVSRLNDIDKQRNQVKAQLRALHGQPGRSRHVARLKNEDGKLLADRNDTCQQIGDIKKLIKAINKETQPKHEVLAANFMRVVRDKVSDEVYQEYLDAARQLCADEDEAALGIADVKETYDQHKTPDQE